MTGEFEDIRSRLYPDGEPWFDYQLDTLHKVSKEQPFIRHCLFYRTGAGKTKTAAAILALKGRTKATVVTPPIARQAWINVGKLVGCEVEAISHTKFRDKSYQLVKNRALIVDEFHLLGGIKGVGFRKLERRAPHLQADLVILSATPNYNDAERVYCVVRTLHPEEAEAGLEGFIYRHCTTERSNYSIMPIVTGFHLFNGAADFLASLPYVSYVPDDAEYTISDIEMFTPMDDLFMLYNINTRKQRFMASQIEKSHALAYQQRVDEHGFLHPHVEDMLGQLVGEASTPSLVFAYHEKIARAIANTCDRNNAKYALLTGKTTEKQKHIILGDFISGMYDMLIGTATLSTGADGMDKMCDNLVIVHDSPDDAFRRQLVGRILVRGSDIDNSRKRFSRLVFPTGS